MHTQVGFEATRFVEVRRRLIELYPEIDDETLADTLEGATNLQEALQALVRSAIEDECIAKALKERTDQMKCRLARLEARAVEKRRTAIETMQLASLTKLVAPDFTASVRLAPPAVEITDEWSLPGEFLVPQPSRPDRRALLDALVKGSSVPGAMLANRRLFLTVRTQ